MATGIDKILADLAKATDRFNAAASKTTPATNTSNFTYDAGNPLSDVGFYNAAAKNSGTKTDTPVADSDVAAGPDLGGFTPVVYGGTITLPSGEIVEVVDGKIQGPVDYTLGIKPGDFIDPTFKSYAPPPKPPKKEETKDLATRDAFALLEELFRSYGLEELVPVIKGYMQNDIGPNEAKVLLKQNPIYKTRFNGNELRIAKGLNALSEAEYLALENDYSETLTSYGLSDYFGSAAGSAGRKARITAMSSVIGGDISAVEFKDRIKTAVVRVKDADTGTKDAFRSLYGVTDTDLVKYFLDPKTGSAQLQQKVTAAEISGASLNAGLGLTSLGSAEELAKLGITKAMAQTGYENISEYLPKTTSLGNIYSETGIQYTKTTGEEEEFKGLASAKRKRERLKELETGTFKGSSGTNKVSLAQRTGSF
jgi:hypothetical protein